jgi:hypothetical protein
MAKHWLGGVAAIAALVGIAFAADGVRWITTSQVKMPGMPFTPPPQTSEFCAPLVWTQPPPAADQSCRSTNFKRIDNKATWDTVCTGRMRMTGTGEMTFEGTDKYTGRITASAEGMTMIIELSGRKADPPNACATAP